MVIKASSNVQRPLEDANKNKDAGRPTKPLSYQNPKQAVISRKPVVQAQKSSANDAKSTREPAAVKPATERALISTTAQTTRLPVKPSATAVRFQDRRAATPTSNQGWTSTLRSGNLSAITMNKSDRVQSSRQECKTELNRLREECNSKIESVIASNAELKEELCDLRNQLNAATAKAMDKSGYLRSNTTTNNIYSPLIDTDRLLADLSITLSEYSEFKKKVVELIDNDGKRKIEEYGKQNADEDNAEIVDSSSSSDSNKNSKQQAPSRPTTIRDESYVIMNYNQDSDDKATVNETSPRVSKVGRNNDQLFSESHRISSNVDSLISKRKDDLNHTFTISDVEDDAENGENQLVKKNRPTIDENSKSSITMFNDL